MARIGENQTALITGSSGGIGLELARQFAHDGYNLILVARSAAALESLAQSLAREFRISATAIPSDLGRIGAAADVLATLEARGLTVDVLVNNAGYCRVGALADSTSADQLGMIDLDIRVLVELTQLFWPRILKRGRGGVLNVASTAAFQPLPLMAVYGGAKAFVLSFSEALWEEARGSGVNVSCLCPGATRTGFAQRASAENTRLFKGRTMSPRDVARQGYRAFQSNRRVRITGTLNRLLAWSVRFAPRTSILKIGRWLISN
jgi:uncharacterized protein